MVPKTFAFIAAKTTDDSPVVFVFIIDKDNLL
jgi:hypothetical protein